MTNNNWLATVRGRAGYAFDRVLVYGTAGAAFGDVRANFSNDPVSSTTEPGWTVGAGVEFALRRELDGQGGVSLRRSGQWFVHDGLRHPKSQRTRFNSERRGKIQ